MALRATPEDENVKNPNRRSSDFIISGLTKNQQLTSHFRDRFKTGVGNNSYDRSAAISWMPASYKGALWGRGAAPAPGPGGRRIQASLQSAEKQPARTIFLEMTQACGHTNTNGTQNY